MKKILILAAMACMASCQNTTTKTPAIDTTNFDLTVAPNADFYQYATGGWQAKNPLKPEYSRYGSFDVLRENNEKRINALFSEMTRMETAAGQRRAEDRGPLQDGPRLRAAERRGRRPDQGPGR